MFKKKSVKKIMMAAALGVASMTSMVGGVASASPLQDIQNDIGTDKFAHFGVGYVISDVLGKTTKLTPLERGLIVTGLETAKEATDAEWSNKDLLATVLGAATNLAIGGKF